MEILYRTKFIVLIMILYPLHSATSRTTVPPNDLVSLKIPENRDLKKSLGYYDDTYLNFTELATKYGHTSETHTVITEDGYILTVFRLLTKCKEGNTRYPVLLVHGMFDSSDNWVLAGPEISLGFVLAINCYDVWAPNLRGNYYSRRHIRLNPDKDREYWNYSFDEHGKFDLPAVVDYVLKKTEKPQVYYIGHSQGTTDVLSMNSLKPEYNDKIRLSILLAPIVWMNNTISPPAVIAAHSVDVIKSFLESAGIFELFPRDGIVHNLAELICQFYPKLCELALNFATGYVPGTIALQTVSVAVGHLLSGGSIKMLAHLAQLIDSGKFQQYDEGLEGNMERYGMPKPPEYNMQPITSPVLLVCAKNDWVSSLKDVHTLASKLPNLVETYVVPEPYWSHHNHIWGTAAPEFVYKKILNYLNKFDT